MSANPSDAVRLTKLLRVPRERVYHAWLDPAVRRQWWGASPEMKCTSCEIDAQVDGAYRVNMIGPDGQEHVTVGRFVELDPPAKLAFTWTWEQDPTFGGDSLVTIELFETEFEGEAATELVLTHERLTNAHQRSEHTSGWMGCLRSLASYFKQPETACGN